MALGNIYYFNPTCELAVANGSFSYQPPLLLQEMERDLAILPFVFCTKNDFVLTENQPPAEFIQKLGLAGFDLPRFCNLAELEAFPDDSFDAIYPWGWSPAAHFKLKNLKEKCSAKFKHSPVFNWDEKYRLLFERSSSLGFLTQLLNNNAPDWFIGKELIGRKVTSCDEIDALLGKHSPLVLKAPLSSSGRGIQIIRKTNLNLSNKQWILGLLKQQKYLIAEPFLEKIMDISFQFRIKSEVEVEYLGFSVFETNSNGQYKGTLINPDFSGILKEAPASEITEMINTTAGLVTQALKNSFYTVAHRGYLGVDAMIFKSQSRIVMQPCIEVNCRMNMGILALFLQKRTHPSSMGKFELFLGKSGEYQSYTMKKMQPVFQDGKLLSGFLPLTQPDKNSRFGAYISSCESR